MKYVSCQQTKHNTAKYHFVHKLYKSQEPEVNYCSSENMTVGLLTKFLETIIQFTQDIGLTYILMWTLKDNRN